MVCSNNTHFPPLIIFAPFDTDIQSNKKNIDEIKVKINYYNRYFSTYFVSRDIINYSKLIGATHIPCCKHTNKYLSYIEYIIFSVYYTFNLKINNPLLLFNGINFPQAILLRFFISKQIIVAIHYNWYFQKKSQYNFIYNIFIYLIQYFCFKVAIKYIALSRQLYNIPITMNIKKEYSIIPNYVDRSIFKPQVKNISILRQYNIKNKFILLFVGRIHPVKRVEDILMVMEKFRISNIKLLIVGDGALREEYQKKYNRNKNIIFCGLINHIDIPKFLSVGDILILPSKTEGQPRVIIEAFASKILVIASNVEGNNDLIKKNKTGILYNVGDISELYTKILYVYNNRNSIKVILDNSYNFFLSNFEKSIVLKKEIEFLQGCLL